MDINLGREELIKLNRLLDMVVECNQALVRAKEENELIDTIQEILESEDFHFKITCETLSDLDKYKTHLVFPLRIEEEDYGYFQVYTNSQISDIEYKILKDLADDIAYGINALRSKRALEISEKRYKSLFENAPIALLEEDFSSVKEYLYRLRGLNLEANELEKYLDNHPDEVIDCLKKIKIVDVNNACLGLYRAKSKDELLGNLESIIREESIEIGKKLILSLYRGELSIEGENVNYTLDGKPLIVYTKTFIPAGYENTLKRAIVSVVDITEQRNLEVSLRNSRQEIKTALEDTIKVLSKTVEIKDPYIAGHQLRVSRLASEIARRMNMKYEDIELIEKASLLHDLGKIAIPGEVLNKPGKLTDTEFELVKLHPLTGYKILSETKYLSKVAEIILQHHERLNGSGYPKGLKDGEISLPVRIIGVADVAEAMLSHRPYRPSYSLEDVIKELERGKGILYDTDVVNICVEILKGGFSF